MISICFAQGFPSQLGRVHQVVPRMDATSERGLYIFRGRRTLVLALTVDFANSHHMQTRHGKSLTRVIRQF